METIFSLNIFFSSLLKEILLNKADYLGALSEFTTEVYAQKGKSKKDNSIDDSQAIINEYTTTLNNTSNTSKGRITSTELLSSVLLISFEVTYSNTQTVLFIENQLKLNSRIIYYRLSNIMEIEIQSSSMEYKAKCDQKEIPIGLVLNTQPSLISIDDLEKRYPKIHSHLKRLCWLIDSKEFPMAFQLKDYSL